MSNSSALRLGPIAVADQQVLGLRVLLDRGDPGPAVYLDAIFVLGAGAVVLELLAEGPHVHEEHGRLQAGRVLAGDDGLLQPIHAADGGAVVVADLLVPGADAGKERHLDRRLLVRWPYHMALRRAGGGQHPLEFQGGQDVLEFAVAVFLLELGIEDLVSRREDDRSDVDLFDDLLHLVIDRVRRADLLAVCRSVPWSGIGTSPASMEYFMGTAWA